jgi:hypothetical protein
VRLIVTTSGSEDEEEMLFGAADVKGAAFISWKCGGGFAKEVNMGEGGRRWKRGNGRVKKSRQALNIETRARRTKISMPTSWLSLNLFDSKSDGESDKSRW